MEMNKKMPSIKQVRETMKQKRWGRLLCIALIIACVCVAWSLMRTQNGASIVMNIHFEEGAQGKNPDGSRFAVSEILSPEVLDAAAKKLGTRVNAQTLRRHLTVSDQTGVASVERVNSAVYNGEKNYAEYPAQYRLSYHIVSPQAVQGGVGSVMAALWEQVFLPGKGKILRAVAQSHEEYFRENHLKSDAGLTVDWEEIDGMDHYNRAQAVEMTMWRACRLLEEESASAAEFESAEDGTSFGDLKYLLGQINTVEINDYKAYVQENGLTTDRETLLQQLRNFRDSKREEHERQNAAYEVCMQAISTYDPDTTRVVFIPSLDTENAFYMSRTKVGMDLLVERADKAKTAADQAQHDALHYDYLLKCFAVEQKPTREQLQRGEEMYASLKDKLSPLFEQVGQLLAERQDWDMQYVDYGKVDYGMQPISMAMGCAKPFVMLSVCTYLVICAWQTVGAKMKKREGEHAHVGK